MLSHKTRYVDGCGSVKKSEEVGNLAPAFSKQFLQRGVKKILS